MPWNEVTTMLLRREFISLATKEGAKIAVLCRRFGISRKTGYKWLKRFIEKGEEGLLDHSKRPNHSPGRCPRSIEEAILKIRDTHSAWGGRKIRKRLQNLGVHQVPSSSTITAILKRNDRIDQEESIKHKAVVRFEAEKCNDLWQMDFKGWIKIQDGQCHPLTVLDDHSRYSLGIEACRNEQGETVKTRLIEIFRRYGLPQAILSDNGPPFGGGSYSPYTPLTVWLIRLGIKILHGRPYHPQTQGKDERFHRTLKAEVLKYCSNLDIFSCQEQFDIWRDIYNYERPHEALNLSVPAERYSSSRINYHEVLPPVDYGNDDEVRKVNKEGWLSYKSRKIHIGDAFGEEIVALRKTIDDGIVDVFYCNQQICRIDLKNHKRI